MAQATLAELDDINRGANWRLVEGVDATSRGRQRKVSAVEAGSQMPAP